MAKNCRNFISAALASPSLGLAGTMMFGMLWHQSAEAASWPHAMRMPPSLLRMGAVVIPRKLVKVQLPSSP